MYYIRENYNFKTSVTGKFAKFKKSSDPSDFRLFNGNMDNMFKVRGDIPKVNMITITFD